MLLCRNFMFVLQRVLPLRQRLSLINDAFAAYLESSSVALFGYRCCKGSAFCDNQQTFVCKIR